jgi:hypothetical protein
MITKTMSQGKGIETFTESISEKEMDRRLEAQHDEVVAMLEQAKDSIACGDVASLEPLHLFLRKAQENFEAEVEAGRICAN